MGHFYGDIKGNRGSASRMGSKQSGITAHIRGWKIGVRVDITHENDRDCVRVYRTTGSSPHGESDLIAKFSDNS